VRKFIVETTPSSLSPLHGPPFTCNKKKGRRNRRFFPPFPDSSNLFFLFRNTRGIEGRVLPSFSPLFFLSPFPFLFFWAPRLESPQHGSTRDKLFFLFSFAFFFPPPPTWTDLKENADEDIAPLFPPFFSRPFFFFPTFFFSPSSAEEEKDGRTLGVSVLLFSLPPPPPWHSFQNRVALRDGARIMRWCPPSLFFSPLPPPDERKERTDVLPFSGCSEDINGQIALPVFFFSFFFFSPPFPYFFPSPSLTEFCHRRNWRGTSSISSPPPPLFFFRFDPPWTKGRRTFSSFFSFFFSGSPLDRPTSTGIIETFLFSSPFFPFLSNFLSFLRAALLLLLPFSFFPSQLPSLGPRNG